MNDYMPDDVAHISERMVKPGEICISQKPSTRLFTRGLGASVAIGIYDPQSRVAGLAHVLFSHSKRSKKKGGEADGLFADQAVSGLFEGMQQLHEQLSHSSCVVSLVGGGNMLGGLRPFSIGGVVVAAIRAQLQEYGVIPAVEDISGYKNRSFSIWTDSGDMCIAVNGKHTKLV